ncbi:hypothetical protein D6D25_08508 [Aureobasidium pullulans]|nr:hypothetical protein D6D25_08508 [Aureobasidium pullulans]
MPTSNAEALTLSPTSGPLRHIRKHILKMKHKLEIYNVDSTKEDSNSAKRGRKDPAELPRDDDRLFVTPDPEDPHKHRYLHREDIESVNPAAQDDRVNDDILETDPGADEEAPKADDQPIAAHNYQPDQSSKLLALPAGPIAASPAYPVIARTTRGYAVMTQQEVENQERVFRKATYQCLHPECDNKKGQGYASEVSRAEHWRRAHERGYSQYPGGMRGLQPFTVL